MVGFVLVFVGVNYVYIRCVESFVVVFVMFMVVWLFIFLVMGIVCKEIYIGYGCSKRLVSLLYIDLIFELMFLL